MKSGGQFRRLEELFFQVSELPPKERRRRLDVECAGEPDLRRKVEAMLAAEEKADARIRATVDVGLADLNRPQAPHRIGPYRVLREIGRGGFATVYLAERDDAQFSMRVAIKLVRRDLRSDDVVRRLRRERQILAGLDHPNIARILDGGSTEDGTPYVVMEHIDGVPVDVFCDRAGLDLRRRLELFRQICHAVRYAHQNLVLHRDIKPSNILVTADGVVKLLDFGIAKLLHDESSELITGPDLSGTLTHTGVRVLTPEYASPEQVENGPLTTATDVYALGVVLYRLVTGERPYRFSSRRWSEVERVVCDVEPEPPSTNRDLDTIVLTALHKRPERRYATAEQLEEDLRRYLEGLPILARRDSWGYRAGKFVTRHRGSVATAAVVSLALIGATVFALVQAHQANQARQRAEMQRVRATQVAEFMEELFETSDPYRSPDKPLTALEVLDQGQRNIRSGLEDDPEMRAALMATMGRVYRRIHQYEEAEELLGQALEMRREVLGEQDVETAESWRDLGVLAIDLEECGRAAAALDRAEQIERRSRGEEGLAFATILYYQGRLESKCGDRRRADEFFQQALGIRRQHLADDSEEVIEIQGSLASLAHRDGDYVRAVSLYEELVARVRRSMGGEHPDVATAMSNLAVAVSANGDPKAALELWQGALEIYRRAFSENHGTVAQILYNIGIAHKRLGENDASEQWLRESLEIAVAVYGPVNPQAANCHHHLGDLRYRLGEPEAAERHYAEALAMRRELYGDEHPKVAQSLYVMATLVADHDARRAARLYRQAIEIQESSGPEDFRLSYPLIRLAELLRRQGDLTAAEPLYRRALELRRAGLPEDHWEVAIAEAYLGQCLADVDKREEAGALFEASLRRLTASLGSDDERTKMAVRRLEEFRNRAQG